MTDTQPETGRSDIADLPTDQEVRERFIDGFPIDTWAVSRDDEGKRFGQWLNGRLARAWDEAEDAWVDFYENPALPRPVNPYRKATGDE